jgi:GNAT superfamily N-acetyltransferase
MSRTQLGLEIRQAGCADREAIAEFFSRLSPRSRYLRFFTSAPSLSAKMVRILSGGGDNIDVVVATEQGAVIGHAMAVDAIGPGGIRSADIGVVVADDRQGRGVGARLILAMTGRARRRGVTTFVMDVLAENRPVLAMIARRWPEAHHEISRASVTVRAHLRAIDHADGPWAADGVMDPHANGHRIGLPVPERAQPGPPCASPGKIPVDHGRGRVLLSTSDR